MRIIEKSGNYDSVAMFRMLNGKCDTLKNHVGEVFNVIGYVSCETDDEKTILYIATENPDTSVREILATNSGTVKRTFAAMIISFGMPDETNPINNVVVTSGKSRNGRDFIDLDIVE